MTTKIPKDFIQKIDFLGEIDKAKSVIRKTHIMNGSRLENDAEHSWHLALAVILFHDYRDVDSKFNLYDAVVMALIHDLVEIYAGDAFPYDKNYDPKKKREKESEATKRLLSSIPQPFRSYFKRLWKEYELGITVESRVVHALDKFMPILNNRRAKGRTWKQYGITKKQIVKYKKKAILGISSTLWEYTKQILDESVKKGYLTK